MLDSSGEIFYVLKEEKQFGEYRTRRLVIKGVTIWKSTKK